MKIMKVLSLALAIGLLACSSAPANIAVSWDPAVITLSTVGQQGSMGIYADVLPEEAIVAWGLDLYFEDEAIASVSNIVYGPLWSEVSHDPTAQDLTDGVDYNMAAIGLFPPGSGASGHLLLATLTFTSLTVGDSWLYLGAHNPPDLNEGFARNPPPSGFIPFSAADGRIIPEPATLALLGLVGLALIRRR